MTDPHGTHDAHPAGAHVPDVHGGSHAVEGAHGSTSDHGGDGHGHDDHAHGGDTLGATDWPMWGAGLLGVVLALLVAAGFVLATGFSFSA